MRVRTLASMLILAGVLAQPTVVSAQVDAATTDTNVRADRNDGGDMSWLGLLGLVGLLGLRNRERKNANDLGATRRTA